MLVRINAGLLPPDHWAHQNGGRIVGEFCHFVDWARAVAASPIRKISAVGLPDGVQYHGDNLAVTLSFADGSVASLAYLANGSKAMNKEYFEVFCEGGVARLDDFRTLELYRGKTEQKFKAAQDKGHKREVQLTIEAMAGGKPAPIPFSELAEVTEATFLALDAARSGQCLALGPDTEGIPVP